MGPRYCVREYPEDPGESRSQETPLAILFVPAGPIPRTLERALSEDPSGKPVVTPWFRLDGHIGYIFRLPYDFAYELPIERDGIRLVAFQSVDLSLASWALGLPGSGALIQRHPAPLPRAIVSWLLPRTGRKGNRKQKLKTKSEGASRPKVVPPAPPSFMQALRGDDEIARYVFERLGGKKWGRRKELKLDHHVRLTKRLGVWMGRYFAPEKAADPWLSLDALASLAYGLPPTQALIRAAADCGRLVPIIQQVKTQGLACLEQLFWRRQEGANKPPFIRPPTGGREEVCYDLPRFPWGSNEGRFGSPSWRLLVTQVYAALAAEVEEGGKQGHCSSGTSIRHLQEHLNFEFSIWQICNALNWLAAVGFISKIGKNVRPRDPTTSANFRGYPERYVLNPITPEIAWARWNSINFASPNRISKNYLSRFWPEEEVRKIIHRVQGRREAHTEAEELCEEVPF